MHDITWGTKGDNKISTDLGVVKTSGDATKANAGNAVVEVDAPVDSEQINAAYEDALAVLHSKPPPEDKKPDLEQKNKDYYQSFRTRVLLFWTLSNVRSLSFFISLVYLPRRAIPISATFAQALLAAIVV